jgi:hypothetical protein
MMDYLERYTRLITDGTPQRPEYMRYFSARSPKSCDVGHAMNDVSPCTPSLYATGKIDNGAPSADFVVHQSVEQMVEAFVNRSSGYLELRSSTVPDLKTRHS